MPLERSFKEQKMTFKDIFKKSFIEGFSRYDMSPVNILIVMAISTAFAIYIFMAYRLLTRKTFYSKTFNISLAAVTVITSAIILTIQSSVVISLGMVGALSIVRFRTAVKEPMDLAFLFWAISTGIICGAGLYFIAVPLTLILVAVGWVIFRADNLPQAWSFFAGLFHGNSLDDLKFFGNMTFLSRAVWIFVMLLVEWIDRREEHGLSMRNTRCRAVRYAIYFAVILVTMLYFDDGSPKFIYFQF